MYPVSTEEEARRAVRDYVRNKVALVKIWVDDREGKLKTLPPPLYRAIIDEAQRHNVPVAAHTVKLADAKELYKAGLEGATHIPVRGGEVPDDEMIAIIKARVARSDRPIWFTEHGDLTALGPEAWDDPLLWEMLPREQVQRQQGDALKRMTPDVVERARRSSKETGDVAKQLIGAGMKLVYGSDNGSAGRGFGWYEQLRFENWVTMGFTPAEAIVMATRDSADVGKFNTGMVAAGQERRLHRPRRQSAREHRQHAADQQGLPPRRGSRPRRNASEVAGAVENRDDGVDRTALLLTRTPVRRGDPQPAPRQKLF